MESQLESSESSDPLVPPSLRTLLDEVLNYTGLFPPAELSLPQALRSYADHREAAESWMLSRFVLPVRQLPDLTPHRRQLVQGAPYRFSVLGTGGPAPESFLDALGRDLDVIDRFDAEFGGQSQVDVMEVPLPDPLVGGTQADAEAFLKSVDRRLVRAGTAKLDLFFDVPLRPSAVDALPALCAALADHNSRQPLPARSEAGLKVRCGGGSPSDVPSVEPLAALIVACRNAGIPLIADKGLQHPLRHYDDGFDTEMHGFLNLVGAAVLAVEQELDVDTVQAILQEDTAQNFRFEKEIFSWRNISTSLDGIRHARDTLLRSFGSCSFEDPVDRLRDLDLL